MSDNAEIESAKRINRMDLIGKKSWLWSLDGRAYAISMDDYINEKDKKRSHKEHYQAGCTIELIPSAIALERFLESHKRNMAESTTKDFIKEKSNGDGLDEESGDLFGDAK